MEALEAIKKILEYRQFSRTIITHDHSQHNNCTAAEIRSCRGMDSSPLFSTVARCWLIVDLISCRENCLCILLSCACNAVEHVVLHAAVFFEIETSYHDSVLIALSLVTAAPCLLIVVLTSWTRALYVHFVVCLNLCWTTFRLSNTLLSC